MGIITSGRVERVLEEIAQLSPEELTELARRLPTVLQTPGYGRAGSGSVLTREAVERAIANRERLRAQLLAEGKPLSSISDDIEMIRAERDAELITNALGGRDPRIRWVPASPPQPQT